MPTTAGDRRRGAERIVAAAIVLVCLVPLLASAVHVGRGWVPASDTAIIATRARDVVGGPTPLLGQPSTAGATVGRQVHHPGPLEYWAIALGQGVVDHRAASLVVIALVNGAAVAAALWWVRAMGGVTGLALAAVPVVTLLWSLRGEALVDPLNPSAAVLPFGAFLVALVATARGKPWAATTAVLAGSWAAQAHLTVTGLVVVTAATVGGVAIAARGGGAHLRRRRGRAGGDGVHEVDRPRPARAPVVVALLALAACWAGPVLDAVANEGGNVVALADAGGAVEPPPRSTAAAIDRTVRALTWRPLWAQAGADVAHLLAPPTDGDRRVVGGLLVVGLAAAVANRRRAPALGWAFAVATIVLVTGTGLSSRLPGSFFNVFQPGNYLWLWPTGALAWAAAVGGVLVAVATRLAAWRPPVRWAPAAIAGLALSVAGAVAVASSVDPSHRIVQRDGPATIEALGRQLAARLDPGSTYAFDLSFDLDEQVVDVGLVLELERRGFDVRVPPAFEPSFGPRRAAGSAEADGTLVLDLDGRGAAPTADRPGGQVVAAYRPSTALVARLDAAERAVAGRVDAEGGPGALLYPALGIDEPATTLAFVRGDLLGLVEIGLLPGGIDRWPELRALAAVRALPVRGAVVRLLPGGPATTLAR